MKLTFPALLFCSLICNTLATSRWHYIHGRGPGGHPTHYQPGEEESKPRWGGNQYGGDSTDVSLRNQYMQAGNYHGSAGRQLSQREIEKASRNGRKTSEHNWSRGL